MKVVTCILNLDLPHKVCKKLLLSIFLYPCVIIAGSVPEGSARIAAINFFKSRTHNDDFSTILTLTRYEVNRRPDFYVYNMKPSKGFVIIAADDEIDPVLAYSTESAFPAEDTPVIVTRLTRESWIAKHKSDNLALTKQRWVALLKGESLSPLNQNAVTPLLQTRWDQYQRRDSLGVVRGGNTKPYLYQALCPTFRDDTLCITGCNATAMAQVMRYFSFPSRGTGLVQYHDKYRLEKADFGNTHYAWNNMPDQLKIGVTTDDKNSEVNQLMLGCGIAIISKYGDFITETTANGLLIKWVLASYFGYNPLSMQYISPERDGFKNDLYLVKGELTGNYPVIFIGTMIETGKASHGHTWVCDGVDDQNLLHMNWGWSGGSNGYFRIDVLDPGVSQYDDEINILVGIRPINKP